MKDSYAEFLGRFKTRLHQIFHQESNIDQLSLSRGLPDEVWKGIMDEKPLSVAVPEEFGGRGVKVSECLGILSAASYESLPLSLTFGINIALFLEPLAKYGNAEIKAPIFDRFVNHGAMGGLMITEPDFGSDALNMRTTYTENEKDFHLQGTKHWQGLTGMADFWIVAARKAMGNGDLARDIEFFVTNDSAPEQKIQVERLYNNLGLYMIPYGINQIDLTVPHNQKLEQKSTGIKMMLDILHRSRLQFPGMGMGFIHRLLDESLNHCLNRKIGGQPLANMDSIQFQLSRIQAAYTLCSGMCSWSSGMSGIDQDLATEGLQANSMKALVTDLMQESAQICVQLSGSSGYKLDHVGGRGIIDSRPFQIFEGSNEMLYTQIAEIVTKQMRKMKEFNLATFLSQFEFTSKVWDRFKKSVSFSLVDVSLPQRKMVLLGKSIARMVCLQYVSEMVEKGFRTDLYENASKHMAMDVEQLLVSFSESNDVQAVVDYAEGSNWLEFV